MMSEAEIARMRKLLEQNGYDGDFSHTVSTRPEFLQVGIRSGVHIFALKGPGPGEAYLWRHEQWAADQPYALAVQEPGRIDTWEDAMRDYIRRGIVAE